MAVQASADGSPVYRLLADDHDGQHGRPAHGCDAMLAALRPGGRFNRLRWLI